MRRSPLILLSLLLTAVLFSACGGDTDPAPGGNGGGDMDNGGNGGGDMDNGGGDMDNGGGDMDNGGNGGRNVLWLDAQLSVAGVAASSSGRV